MQRRSKVDKTVATMQNKISLFYPKPAPQNSIENKKKKKKKKKRAAGDIHVKAEVVGSAPEAP